MSVQNSETSVVFLQYEKANKPNEIPGFQALEGVAPLTYFPDPYTHCASR